MGVPDIEETLDDLGCETNQLKWNNVMNNLTNFILIYLFLIFTARNAEVRKWTEKFKSREV